MSSKLSNLEVHKNVRLPAQAKRLLFLGDSITHRGLYAAYVELGFVLHQFDQRFTFINGGLPSETVSGLSEPNHADGAFPRPCLHDRLDRVLAQVKPDAVFACYGMNDGIFLPPDEVRLQAFGDGMRRLHEVVFATGASIIHVTSPVYDDVGGQRPRYREVLAAQAAWLLDQRRMGWSVIDVYGPMAAYLDGRRKQDSEFKLAQDGVHPAELGHWLIAKEILAALGFTAAAEHRDIEALAATVLHGEIILRLITEREELWRDAWLTQTGHKRPGLKSGLPIFAAESTAIKITTAIGEHLTGSVPRPVCAL
jgi:lysophospholipase L1-like esterase